MIELSIILPVHNEAHTIESVIDSLRKIMQKSGISFEILCIENGSTDASLDIMKKLENKHQKIHVYQSAKGWGNAVQHGVHHAEGEYICYMVSDGQIDTGIIPSLYSTLIRKDIGMIKIKRVTRENKTRFINSQIYNLLARLLFGLSSADINGTPKILKKTLVQKLDLHSPNIAIDLELLIKLKANTISWKEIAVESKIRDGGSSTTTIKSVIEMLLYMKQFVLQKKRWNNLVQQD